MLHVGLCVCVHSVSTSSLDGSGHDTPEVEPPPEDASQLWHFWGGGGFPKLGLAPQDARRFEPSARGNTGMSGQMTNNPELVPSETEDLEAFTVYTVT